MDADPRAGGNYVQPIEDHQGNQRYEVYIGWRLVETKDDEADARVCLESYFPALIRT